MLVKLAFAMQRLKKYIKKICQDQQRWGRDAAVMRGDIELMGVLPLGKTLGILCRVLDENVLAQSSAWR